jgi:hypothetical protein
MVHLHFLCARRVFDAVTQVKADGEETEITIAMGHAYRINKIQVWRVRAIKYIAKLGQGSDIKKHNATTVYETTSGVDSVLSHLCRRR